MLEVFFLEPFIFPFYLSRMAIHKRQSIATEYLPDQKRLRLRSYWEPNEQFLHQLPTFT